MNIVEQVKIIILFNHYNMKDCEPCLENLYQTLYDVILDYKKAFDEKNTVTQELFHLSGQLEGKKLKVIMLERDLLLEKEVGLFNKTQLDATFNQ